MRPAREAIVLPVLFLTSLLLGGLRVGEPVVLSAPSPYALVLGVLLLRIVIQSGALAPAHLLSASRPALANANGAVVIATLWTAAAQTMAALVPESGVPRLGVSVFLLVLLLNTAAAAPGRQHLLRSLAVTFGALFVVKFVVLHQLSATGASAVKRALQALVDGVTLGALMQEVPHPATGYSALGAVLLFLIGVVLLPHGSRPPPGEGLMATEPGLPDRPDARGTLRHDRAAR